MVFRYPKDESMDYIKRVIGVPGDVVKLRQQAPDHATASRPPTHRNA
ncbi:S26 family signal peptidase [Cupriavidus basilensis]